MANKYSFPPKWEMSRFHELKRYKAVYDGDVKELLSIFNKDKSHLYIDVNKKKVLYIAINLPAKISEYFSSLIVGDGVFFNVDGDELQETINDIVEKNDLNITLLEGSIDQSRYGYYLLNVRLEDEDKIIIEQIPNDQFVISFSNDIKPKIKRLELFAFLTQYDESGERVKKKYLYKKIYFYPNEDIENEEVMIKNELWLVDSFKQPVEKVEDLSIVKPGLEEFESTGLFKIPARLINNSKPSENRYGKSDYKDLMSLFEELNDKVSMVSKQLIKHMNSKVIVPSGTLDDDGNITISESDVLEVGEGQVEPKYLVNTNPQIDQGFKHIEHLIRDIAAIAQVPLQALGFDAKGGVESPEGFRLRNFETEQRINKKRIYMETPLKAIMNIALEMLKEEEQKIDIVWSNVMPIDMKLKTDVLSMQVASQLKSRRTAIKELQELDDEQLQEELDLIDSDFNQPTNLNNFTTVSGVGSQPPPEEETQVTNPLLDNI